MTTAFVLTGGGSLGAVQVGMLLALAERGVRPELIVGTSAGSVNGAWVASRPGVEGAHALAATWRRVRRADVFPIRPLIGLRGFLGAADHLVPPSGLRRLVAANVAFARLEDAPVPLAVIASDARTGAEVVLTHGDAVDAVMASSAIPAVFPPVTVEGRALLDGAVADTAPLAAAADLGASTVWVLPTGFPCGCPAPPRGAIGMAVHAVTLATQRRLAAEAAGFREQVDLHIVPPPCPLTVSPFDFDHTSTLIDTAHTSTEHWLAGDDSCAQALERLTPHQHRAGEPVPASHPSEQR